MTVEIQGTGIAALCCLHLLQKAGVDVSWRKSGRPRVPVLMLSDSSLALIRDVFDAPDLLRNAPRIERRVVTWQPDQKPVVMPHAAVVTSEAELLSQLNRDAPEPSITNPDWVIRCSEPAGEEHRFGSRPATAYRVELVDTPADTCWVEAVEDGWLFLIPDSPTAAWLLVIGENASETVQKTRVLCTKMRNLVHFGARFETAPRVFDPLGAPGELSCGSAAMSFDPICGDGTANAVREAILASAVVRNGHPDAVNHYKSRLLSGFYRHLALSRTFYNSGWNTPWWQAQSAAIDLGLDWCGKKVGKGPTFSFRLNGFELEHCDFDVPENA